MEPVFSVSRLSFSRLECTGAKRLRRSLLSTRWTRCPTPKTWGMHSEKGISLSSCSRRRLPLQKKLINALLHLPVAGCPRPREQSVQGLVLGRGVRVANGRGEDVTCFVRRGKGDESFVFTAVRQHRVEVSRQTKRLAWDAFQERGALLGASLSVALDVSSSRPSAPPLQLKE